MIFTVDNRQYELSVHRYDTLIVGSGAAGFSAAERLHMLGQKNIALVTEHIKSGTSRNTGSDKQTYYKLTLSGSRPDSVREMADTLMSGGCVDGDLALCEAALSAQCFFHLVERGVPFPCNRYGEYIGYKTDHDPRERATSAGPYTSKMITEALEQSVREKEIPILDHKQVVRLLTDESGIRGILCLELNNAVDFAGATFVIYLCNNLIYATGGPAGIYENTVYPHGHHGSTGLAFEAGAIGKNLTEWQYGLSSVRPRWNVSGTYMQSLPRFLSTDYQGNDSREFLFDYFDDYYTMLNLIFLKGYQWPFDIQKSKDGSSIIDILVYLEEEKGRRVFLDYTTNPNGFIDFEKLPEESRNYLKKGQACFGTPYERLMQMNEPAVNFYLEHGIDLKKQPLEISLCAQHNNGGLAVDAWWQTNINGLFCIGEASATHGIYRPGGTALNAGQVGALRAAQYIAEKAAQNQSQESVQKEITDLKPQITEILQMANEIQDLPADSTSRQAKSISALTKSMQQKMSLVGAAFRNQSDMERFLCTVTETLSNISHLCHAENLWDLRDFFLLRETLMCQQVYLYAFIDYSKNCPYSRGSALYENPAGIKSLNSLPDRFRFLSAPADIPQKIQEIHLQNGHFTISWRVPRPIPDAEAFFENVWKQYRLNKNVF